MYAEVCKWTDQKTGKIVNNGIERVIEGVKVENIKVKERAVKKIKQAVDEFRRQGKPADLSQKDKEGRRSLLTGDLKDKIKGVVKEFSKSFRCCPPVFVVAPCTPGMELTCPGPPCRGIMSSYTLRKSTSS